MWVCGLGSPGAGSVGECGGTEATRDFCSCTGQGLGLDSVGWAQRLHIGCPLADQPTERLPLAAVYFKTRIHHRQRYCTHPLSLRFFICIVYLAPHGQGLGTRMDTESFKTEE